MELKLSNSLTNVLHSNQPTKMTDV